MCICWYDYCIYLNNARIMHNLPIWILSSYVGLCHRHFCLKLFTCFFYTARACHIPRRCITSTVRCAAVQFGTRVSTLRGTCCLRLWDPCAVREWYQTTRCHTAGRGNIRTSVTASDLSIILCFAVSVKGISTAFRGVRHWISVGTFNPVLRFILIGLPHNHHKTVKRGRIREEGS